MKHLLISLLIAFSCFSCGEKNVELNSQDSKSDAHIKITGEKGSSVDPYKVNIFVEANGKKESVGTEIFSGSLDSSNVNFDWQQPGVCLITFSQQDNSTRKILAVALENKIGLKEIGLE